MHELAIATAIVDHVLHEIEQKNLPPVQTVVVEIGALSDVLPDALIFNFDVIKRETRLHDTQLRVEQIPIRARCKSCHNEFSVENFFFRCPACNAGQVEMLRGDELNIAYLEVADEPTVAKREA